MEQTPPNVESPPPSPEAPTSSLASRLFNVIAAPGEVFDEIKTTRSRAVNWLVPAVFASIVGVVFTLVMFSQPTILYQMRQQQEKSFEQQVKNGKMTQQQADQALEMAQKFTGPILKIFGAVSAVVMSFILLFWRGLVLWLIAMWFLKARIPYMKAVEITGLSSVIAVLGAIVALLLMVIFGKMFASASLGLLVSEFDVTNKKHLLLGAVNVFNFWLVAIMSLGLARATGTPFVRALLPVLGYWIAISLALIAVGMGQFAL